MASITRRLVAIPALGLATTIAISPTALAQEEPAQSNSSGQSNTVTVIQSNSSSQSNNAEAAQAIP